MSKRPYGKEFIEFSQFTERMLARIPKTGKVFDAPQAVGELKYRARRDGRRDRSLQADREANGLALSASCS